jgi:hypothetical protein
VLLTALRREPFLYLSQTNSVSTTLTNRFDAYGGTVFVSDLVATKMSAVFEATLRPRLFRDDGRPCSCSPRPPSALDLYHSNVPGNFYGDKGRAERRLARAAARWSTMRCSPVHRPTKLSKARELANKCRLERIKDKVASPSRPAWVVASWHQRVRALGVHFAMPGTSHSYGDVNP